MDDRYYDENYIVDTLRELLYELHSMEVEASIEYENLEEEQKQARREDYEYPFLPSLYLYIDVIEDYIPLLFLSYNKDIVGFELRDALISHINAMRNLHNEVLLKYQNKRIRDEFISSKYKNKSQEENIKKFQSKIEDIYDLMGSKYHHLSDDAKSFREALQKAFSNPYNYVPSIKVGKKISMTPIRDNLKHFHLNNKKLIDEYIREILLISEYSS